MPSLAPSPYPLLTRVSPPQLKTVTPPHFGVKKEWSGAVAASVAEVWKVTSDDLELVPMDYPLERTHRENRDDPCTDAQRISSALQFLSIEAKYVTGEAKAKCKTNDCVGFRIRLYAGSETGEPVIVEMQRRCGSASSFMRSCRAILDAAEGKDLSAVAAQQQTGIIPPCLMRKPVGQLKCLQSISPSKLPAPPSADRSLDNAVSMLLSDKRDANILALESLCCLTDPMKTTPTAALTVSKSIVLGDDKHELRACIRDLMERDVVEAEKDVALARYVAEVQHFALIIFANALSVCSRDGCLAGAILEQSWFVDYLIPSLLDALKIAETKTSNAFHATSCLQSLISASPLAREAVASKGGVTILEEAHLVGLRRHELLSKETKRCLESFA